MMSWYTPLTIWLTVIVLPPSFPGCAPINSSTHMWSYLVPMLTFQTTLCVLAVIKLIQVASARYSTPAVMFVLLRDSAAYFGIILAWLIADITIWAAGRVRQNPQCLCKILTPYPTSRLCLLSLSGKLLPLKNQLDMQVLIEHRPLVACDSILGCRMLVR